MLLSSVSCHGPWRSFRTAWRQLSEGKKDLIKQGSLFFQDSYHHDPDKEEGVANQNEKNRNFTNIEVNPISLKERTILDDILGGAWIVSEDPECDPHRHVDHWGTWCSRTRLAGWS